MGWRATRKGKAEPRRIRRPFASRLVRVGVGAACLLPLLSSAVSLQDMTSLIEGRNAAARWQAFFVPSPAGSIEAASLGFAAKGEKRLPAGAGLSAPNGALYTVTRPGRPALDTPDEARVNRREKTGRVLAATPFAPPKAFSAGSILERQSLLDPPEPDEAAIQTAFAFDGDATDSVQVAMGFAPPAAELLRPAAAPAVMLASLEPSERKPKTASPAVAVAPAALAYAPMEPLQNPVASLFGRVLQGDRNRGFVPPLGRGDHAWAATPLPPAAFSKKEQLCLANGIYYEARGEPEIGQAAVAQVILNRVRNPTYPKTICGVVYQNQTWRNRCQFSFACDGIRKRVSNKRAFSTAVRIADQVTRGETWLPEVGSSTHYHATYVRPRWASAMKKMDKIGRHIFYRTYGGGWR